MDELTQAGFDDSDRTDGGVGDADLVAQVRDGLDEPYAELYRRHQPAALALARTLTEHSGADDVVSEAFEKLLQRIRGGGGPQAAFRPYLLRTVRTVAVDASRRTRRLVVSEDPADAAGRAPTEDDALVDAVHERTTLARAFAALPERWQTLLWLSFVDDADRAEIATILGINVGSVSALGYRAREGLRRAYLDAHLRSAPTPECAEVWPMLASAVRGSLGATHQAEVDQHLAGCDHCRAAAAELEAVNTRFGAALAPIVLGAAAPAYLAAIHDGGTAAAASAAPAAAVVDVHAGAGTALKTAVAGVGKMGATGVAVVACTSTVALVALLAVFTAPLASEPSVSPRPGTTFAGGEESRGPGSGSGSSGSAWSTGVGSSLSAPSSSPTDGDPSTAGTPTTGGPTPTTTGGPTGHPTATPTGPPTGGPTGSSTGGPTSAPTSAGTQPPSPLPTPTTTPPGTPPPTPGGTPPPGTPTATTSGPSPTLQAAPTVDAALAGLVVVSRSEASAPAHLEFPVSLKGGTADLQITATIVGLNKFSTTNGAGEGPWTCVATTPMAGAGKTAVVRCTLNGAAPGDELRLGLDVGYSGDGSVSAVLAVLGPTVDTDESDNTASTDLPPRHA